MLYGFEFVKVGKRRMVLWDSQLNFNHKLLSFTRATGGNGKLQEANKNINSRAKTTASLWLTLLLVKYSAVERGNLPHHRKYRFYFMCRVSISPFHRRQQKAWKDLSCQKLSLTMRHCFRHECRSRETTSFIIFAGMSYFFASAFLS